MRFLALLASVALAFAAALIGSRFPPGDWYASLQKPAWNPPSWLFGPVWTALYLGMAVAAWRVWRVGRAGPALALHVLQLALNAAWSWLFFGLHRPDLAFAEILVLWAAILATTVAFFRKDSLAGWLLVPYLAWVGFAAFLNFTLWRLQ
jgi:translocator protein